MWRKQKYSSAEMPRRRQQDSSSKVEREQLDRYTFRRNRTLTGSSSANISSSNEINADIKSPRAHVHHLSSLRRRLMLAFGLVVAVSGLLYGLVTQIVAETSVQLGSSEGLLSDTDEAAYTKALNSYYQARPVERLRFILNESALLSHVQVTRPEVKSIKVEPGAELGEASVTIAAREAIARWSIDGSNRFVDDQGVVFTRQYGQIPKLQIIDNSGIQASSSQTIASNRFLSFVGRLVAESNERKLTVKRVIIPTLTTRQLAINLAGQKTVYRFSVDRSVGQQVEDMSNINRFLQKRYMSPEYVDVRVQGKAFYR